MGRRHNSRLSKFRYASVPSPGLQHVLVYKLAAPGVSPFSEQLDMLPDRFESVEGVRLFCAPSVLDEAPAMTTDESKQEFQPLGPADFGPGEFRDFQVGGHGVLVANCAGAFHAIEDRCTHDNGSLSEGRLYHCEIACPRHGARFDMKTGRATALPAFNGVASYPVRVVDGQLEIQFTPPPAKRYQDPRDFGGFGVFSR